jgi:hypothetical protein
MLLVKVTECCVMIPVVYTTKSFAESFLFSCSLIYSMEHASFENEAEFHMDSVDNSHLSTSGYQSSVLIQNL